MDKTIRIGTLAGKGQQTHKYLKQILPHGFESFEITFWQKLGGCNLDRLATDVSKVLQRSGAVVSALGIYGNPLADDADAQATRDAWKALIDKAHKFKADLVCGFAGAVPGKSVDQAIARYKEVFGPLAKRAADKGVRLAFENCDMGGSWDKPTWNIAMTPKAWELMFNAFDSANIGLEWEPCHQMVKLIDPMPQLRKWVGKIFHIHGKDATVYWDVVREHGIVGPESFAFHRTPGFGDCNWTDIISELRRGGFCGAIDIEGWHDPVYRGELEMTGQVRALKYLQDCRGTFVPNPAD